MRVKINNRNIRQILFFLIGFPLVIIWGLKNTCNEQAAQNKYFLELDLKLTGVVTYLDTRNGFNDFGIFGVDVISSNKQYIDQRQQKENYYCIVHKNKAELYQIGASKCNIGDTIQVDTNRQMFTISKTNGQKDSVSVVLYSNELFWKYVRKNYQKI